MRGADGLVIVGHFQTFTGLICFKNSIFIHKTVFLYTTIYKWVFFRYHHVPSLNPTDEGTDL